MPFYDLALADMNNDGRLDVLGATGDHNGVYVVLNMASGFVPGGHAFAGGGGTRHIAIADLNRDGRLDVVTANRDSFSVGVLHGDGTGGLTTARLPFVIPAPHSAAVSDFDADGHQDIAVTGVDSRVVVLRGTAQDSTLRKRKCSEPAARSSEYTSGRTTW